MKAVGKMAVVLAFAAFGSAIGAREFASACKSPSQEEGKPDSGHEAATPEKSADGFVGKVCAEGLYAALTDSLSNPSRDAAHLEAGEKHADAHDTAAAPKAEAKGHDDEGFVKLTEAQISAAEIKMQAVGPGTLSKELSVPGRINIDANRLAKVVPKIGGTVAKIAKQIGDRVAAGDVLATLESRELADAKGEYLAAVRAEELARSTSTREEKLWQQKVTAEQDYLQAKNAHAEAVIKLDLAEQKLHAIGLTDSEIATVPFPTQKADTRFYELRSPIDGRVTARNLVMGQIVGTDKEVFSIADLSNVWVELAVTSGDLPFVREGQEVRVKSGAHEGLAHVVAISPEIDADSRSVRVIAELANGDGRWRIGDFVGAHLLADKQNVALMVPRSALQTVKGDDVVFAVSEGGFRLRRLKLGRSDAVAAEVLSGLEPGDRVAASNTFTLKAELGKAEAEHED